MKLSKLCMLGSLLLLGLPPVKADYDRYGIEMGDPAQMFYDGTAYYYSAVSNIYKYNSETGERILLKTNQHCPVYQSSADFKEGSEFRSNDRCNGFSASDYTEYDSKNGTIFVRNNAGKQWSYDIESNAWSFEDAENYTISHAIPLIRRSENGVTSIGQNSLNFQETSEKLNLWGTNLDGKIVPINITSGLTIDDMNVKDSIEENTNNINTNKQSIMNVKDSIEENTNNINTNKQSIKNVGALGAALTGLPTVPSGTTLSCGLGTGTYGGNFAFSGGCASKVNEKLSINYAASMTLPGQEYAGDFEDKFSARAGFVWQLGKSNKLTQVSLDQKKEINLKISKLETDNEFLKADNKELKIKNNKIISQNAKLFKRLEKLENIAFELQKNDGLKLSQRVPE